MNTIDEIRATLNRIIHDRGEARWEAQQHLCDNAEEWLWHLLDAADQRNATTVAINTPAEADKTPARTVLLDKIGDVWQHNIEPETLWEDRIDYWTTPGDEEGHDADELAYPALILYTPEEHQ